MATGKIYWHKRVLVDKWTTGVMTNFAFKVPLDVMTLEWDLPTTEAKIGRALSAYLLQHNSVESLTVSDLNYEVMDAVFYMRVEVRGKDLTL